MGAGVRVALLVPTEREATPPCVRQPVGNSLGAECAPRVCRLHAHDLAYRAPLVPATLEGVPSQTRRVRRPVLPNEATTSAPEASCWVSGYSCLHALEKHMAHPPPQQQQEPGKSGPQLDTQEQLQYPGNEGIRKELVQPDADAQVQTEPRKVRDEGQRDLSRTPDLKPLSDGNSDLPPLDSDTEEPIGDRKDIR